MGLDAAVNPLVKQLYGDVLCQTVSPCGNYLIAGNIFGQIFLFDLRISLSPAESASDRIRPPQRSFSLPEEKAVCCLTSTAKFLIAGSIGRIHGYEWRSVLNKQPNVTPKLAWSWDLPLRKDELECAEVNAVVVTSDGNVWAGCGDKQIHVYSLEDGRHVTSLAGHSDYIHDLRIMDDNQMCSASEDGTVRVWDLRTRVPRAVLEPHKQSSLERPALGKWVGALHVDKEWLLCGGGVRAGLWHLPSLALTTTFETNVPCHVLLMDEERVLVGDKGKISQFNLVGESLNQLACSSNTLMSIAYQQTPHRILSVSGTSQYLDICLNMDCRDQVFACA